MPDQRSGPNIGNDGNPTAPLVGTTEPKLGVEYEVKLLGELVVYVPVRDQ